MLLSSQPLRNRRLPSLVLTGDGSPSGGASGSRVMAMGGFLMLEFTVWSSPWAARGLSGGLVKDADLGESGAG